MKQDEILKFLEGKEGNLTRVFNPSVSTYFLKGAYLGAVKTIPSSEKPDSINILYRVRHNDKLHVDTVFIDERLMKNREEYPAGDAPKVHIDTESCLLTIEYNKVAVSMDIDENSPEYAEYKEIIERNGI